MARAGAFDGIDAAMMVHPAGVDVAESKWVGLRQVDVVYHGLAAHAAATPFMGRYARNLADRGRAVVQVGPVPSGSTDMGNVSVRLPSIHPKIAIAPRSVSLHSAEFARWAGLERGDAGAVDGAIALARTAADFLADEALRAGARAEFEAAGGVVDVPALDR